LRTVRASVTALFALAIVAGCGTPDPRPAAVATPESEGGWRWTGTEVALVGRSTAVPFEREGVPDVTVPSRTVRMKARCVACSSTAPIEFVAAPPTIPYELDPGIAEAIVGSVVFPAEGIWSFEPFGGQITVRSPTSTQPPLVVVRPWSNPLTADCGAKHVENAVARFAQAFNSGRPGDLAQALNPLVDFSMHSEPLPMFVTKERDRVGDFIRTRFLAGETIHPYLVYAASNGDNSIHLVVYFVRNAPDLPSGSKGHSYRRAAAGSRLFCDDLLLLRFNADLLSD
jgi:hypothetical protein